MTKGDTSEVMISMRETWGAWVCWGCRTVGLVSEEVDFREKQMSSEKNDLWFWATMWQMGEEKWRQLKNEQNDGLDKFKNSTCNDQSRPIAYFGKCGSKSK